MTAMKRLLRRVGIALECLVPLGLIACAAVYVLSERTLRRAYDMPPVAISIPTDPALDCRGAAAGDDSRVLRRLRWSPQPRMTDRTDRSA